MDIFGMKRVRKLRVHWPVNGATLARLTAGDVRVFEEDPSLALLLAALAEKPELGDFGIYRHVFESSFGFEGFTVAPGANPTLGSVGGSSVSPTFVLTSYFDAGMPAAAVENLLQTIMDIHPWEVPVLEVSDPVSISTGRTADRQEKVMA